MSASPCAVAIEGALWRTLAKLARPGALTLEYFAGRKRRYLLPLRLYLTAMGGNVAFDCKPGEVVCERIRQRLIDRVGAMTASVAL